MATIPLCLFCLVSFSSVVVALEQSEQSNDNCGDVMELLNAMQVNKYMCIFLSLCVVQTELIATVFKLSSCICLCITCFCPSSYNCRKKFGASMTKLTRTTLFTKRTLSISKRTMLHRSRKFTPSRIHYAQQERVNKSLRPVKLHAYITLPPCCRHKAELQCPVQCSDINFT